MNIMTRVRNPPKKIETKAFIRLLKPLSIFSYPGFEGVLGVLVGESSRIKSKSSKF